MIKHSQLCIKIANELAQNISIASITLVKVKTTEINSELLSKPLDKRIHIKI